MRLAELAKVPGASLEGDGMVEVTGVQYDSRRVKPGDLFVAVQGFRVRGSEMDNVSGQTTTEAPQIQAWLRQMVDAGVSCGVIETTSHALVQERVAACEFDVAAFTNVGHDHLDYHPTWDEYLEAK